MAARLILLDTHAAIWWWRDDPQLSAAARTAIVDHGGAVFVSAASAFEIALKNRIGKFNDIGDPTVRFPVLMDANRFKSLPIRQNHALMAGLLPGQHKDPFDRLIAAQAIEEGFTVVTRDAAILTFGCKVLW